MKNTKLQCKVQHRGRQDTAKQIAGREPLAHNEVVAAFRYDVRFPPLLSLDQAAQLAHLAILHQVP